SGCENKFHEGILDKASEHPIDLPPWTGFEPIDSKTSKNTNLPEALDEVRVAEWLVDSSLEVTLMSSASLGWLLWDGTRWKQIKEDYVRRRVVRAIKLANIRAVDAGLDRNVIKKLNNFLTDSKVKALTSLVRVLVSTEEEGFDSHPHLLNVANGVVDLRTGDLLPHAPKYTLIKITDISYTPGFTHPDWDQVLSSLEPEVADWMQI